MHPTIAMRRAAPAHPGGPVTADVHPDQVDEFLFAGWSLAEGEAIPGTVEEIHAPDDVAFVLPDVESVAAAVHASWMAQKRAAGVTSRKLESGEELMVPYAQLSEPAKELDRATVRTVYAAIEACFKPAGTVVMTAEQPANEADAAQGDASLGTNTASDVPLENAAGESAPAATNADPQNQDAADARSATVVGEATEEGGAEQAAPKAKPRARKAD